MNLSRSLYIFSIIVFLLLVACVQIDGVDGKPPNGTVARKILYKAPFNKSEYIAEVRDSVQMLANVEPVDFINGPILWTSNNPEIAEVLSSGLVVCKTEGSALIKAKVGDISISIRFIIEPEVILTKLETIGANTDGTFTVLVGDPIQLYALIEPEEANEKEKKWTTANASIVVVDQNGLVRGVNRGITGVYLNVGTFLKKLEFVVEVVENPKIATKITLSETSLTKVIDNPGVLIGTVVEPNGYTNGPIVWTSSNNLAVKVDQKGLLLFIGGGRSEIIARIGSVSDTLLVDVRGSTLQGVRFTNESNLNIFVGGGLQLEINPIPNNAILGVISFTSLNVVIANVDQTGFVSGINQGQARMVVQAGSFTDTISITVNFISLEGIKIEGITILEVNESRSLRIIPTPEFAPINTINWSSSNTTIATITSNGIVTGNSAGDVVIRAVSGENSAIMDSFFIKIVDRIIEPTAILIAPNVLNGLLEDNNFQLTTIVYPVNHTSGAILWKSEDSSIVEVTSLGLVRYIGTGVTKIIATVGSTSDTIPVNVGQLYIVLESIIIIGDSTINRGDMKLLTVTGTPSNANVGTITWLSTNESSISINSNGMIIANDIGQARIKATVENTTIFAIIDIRVKNVIPATQIIIQQDSLMGVVGNQEIIPVFIIIPTNHTDGFTLWETESIDIADVTQAGVVSFLGIGETKIIATVGSVSDTVTVIVQ